MRPPKNKNNDAPELTRTWSLSSAAVLGSAVRAKGILLELRARLPMALRKCLDIDGRVLTLAMSAGAGREFELACAVIEDALAGIESLPVIPREIEDILTIKTSERHRWLGDGRLASAGTRTVKLRGRARQITFHVFDPRVVEDLLDRGTVEEWREQDVLAAAENKRRAANKAKLTRSLKKKSTKSLPKGSENGDVSGGLSGWEEFDRDGFLR